MSKYKFPTVPEIDDRDGGGAWEGAFPADGNGGQFYQDWNSFKSVTIYEAASLSLGAHPEKINDFLNGGGTFYPAAFSSIVSGLIRAVLSGSIKTVALDTPLVKSSVTHETSVITEDVYNYFEGLLNQENYKIIEAQETDRNNPNQSYQLEILNQASEKFWANASKEEKDTHPLNKTVSDWLFKKGLSAISAQQGAVIIRPTWAAKGRRNDD